MTKAIARTYLLCFFLLFPIISFTQEKQNVLDQDDVVPVDSLTSNIICFHRNMSLVDSVFHPMIIEQIKLGIDSIGGHIEVTGVEFRVLVFPERTIPELGISGVAPNDREIYLLLDPGHPKFKEAVNLHIIPTLAHEYHHTLRYRTVGYGDNLFEAMISEGLADHFSLEVTNLDALPWSAAMPDSQYEYWREKAEKIWYEPDYDHMAWFIGLNSNIPRGTAYAIGFNIVSDYLKKHPSETAASLYATSADSFLVR